MKTWINPELTELSIHETAHGNGNGINNGKGHGYDNGPGMGPGKGNGYGHNKFPSTEPPVNIIPPNVDGLS